MHAYVEGSRVACLAGLDYSCTYCCALCLAYCVSLCVCIYSTLRAQVYARLEEVVSRCTYMDWKHFDAGVVKVRVMCSPQRPVIVCTSGLC